MSRALIADKDKAEFQHALDSLRTHLGFTRRFFRVFRFLDAFAKSYELLLVMTKLSQQGTREGSVFLEQILEGIAATFNGGYLLLESATLIDALKLPGLAVWSAECELLLKIESQRCWFLALAAGAAACIVRLLKVRQAVATQNNQQAATLIAEVELDNHANEQSNSKAKSIAKGTKIETPNIQVQGQDWWLYRKLVACMLDLALPGSVIGWIPATQGTLGCIMLLTSFLTGLDVWERCGKEAG